MNKVTKVTFDTNNFPINDLIVLMDKKPVEYSTTSVTMREMENCGLFSQMKVNDVIKENGIYGESRYGSCKYGSTIIETAVVEESLIGSCVVGTNTEVDVLETLLIIISSNTFPKAGSRNNLTLGFRHHLRDAMILTAHIREKRDIFITNDEKGFIKNGKREKIENIFKTKIMTRDEFKLFLNDK